MSKTKTKAERIDHAFNVLNPAFARLIKDDPVLAQVLIEGMNGALKKFRAKK